MRRPPRSTLTDTPFPSTTRFRSGELGVFHAPKREAGRENDHIVASPPVFSIQAFCGVHHVLHAGKLAGAGIDHGGFGIHACVTANGRSEEHTSELQSLMRISYAVFCLKKKKTRI